MLTLSAIEEARSRIAGHVRRTPCTASVVLSQLTGSEIFLKFENLQLTGSFKERGASNKLELLGSAERRAGVVTASAGNHAQAVAYHASRLGIQSTVVMPEATPLIKLTSARRYGAVVHLHGASYDDAAERAAALSAEKGYTYIHPFDDLDVMAGQGTIALELLEQVPDLQAIVVPVGGGGLAAGIACAAKEREPGLRIYGVESETFPGMLHAIKQDRVSVIPGGKTIADGIAVRRVGQHAVETVRRYVDDIALVDEEEIAEAILILLEHEKTVVEGAGAVGLAAALGAHLPIQGQRVVVVLSGGNIDVNLMSRIIERGLVKTGRMVRLFLTLPDVTGALARLTQLIAERRANIVAINHDRAFSGAEVGQTSIELVLETHGFEHIAEIRAALTQRGYPVRDI
ncbi:MAG TPA: threonine ammonia-lyase [Polyangiaceae bacterium]|nr:threonine ammonia-lyase [Polyangiaceae bacterium]